MGIVHAHRGRLAPAIILAVLMALAVIVTLGLAAGPASAQASFTTCASCHSSTESHSGSPAHIAAYGAGQCSTCHVNGFAAENAGVVAAACATAACHGSTAGILGTPQHVTNGCGTTPGCHGVAPVVAKTTMTLKASPTSVKVKKSIKFSGSVGPLPTLAGAKIAMKVERKVGKKWVKMKTGTAKVKANGSYSWTYKATKKGAHRATASIAKKTNAYTAKKMVKSFKVK